MSYPPHLLVELLEQRHSHVAYDTGSIPTGEKRVLEFVGEYKAIGYMIEKTFIIIEWSKVTTQSLERQRLEAALNVLRLALYSSDDALRDVYVQDPDLGELSLEDAIDTVLNDWSE